MGRPSLTVNVQQQRKPGAAAGSPESTASETFPRRFPKLGNSFQIRSLPDAKGQSYTSSRAAVRLSNEHPFCTQEEVSQETVRLQEDAADASTRPVTLCGSTEASWSLSGTGNRSLSSSQGYGSTKTILDRNPDVKMSEHPNNPTTSIEQMTEGSDDAACQHKIAATQWMHSVLQWQAIQLGTASATGRRRQIKKRPRTPVVHADSEYYSSSTSSSSVSNSSSSKRARTNAATVSAASKLPLPARANAAVTASALSQIWVPWSAGRTARRSLQRFQPVLSSSSWMTKPEEEPRIAVWGDFRSCPDRYVAEPSQALPAVVTVTSDDPVSMWKAVLACAQAVEGHLSSSTLSSSASASSLASANSETIYLSQLVKFVEYARCLPRPEDVFNASTNFNQAASSHMVEAIALAFEDLQTVIQKARVRQAKLFDLWASSSSSSSNNAKTNNSGLAVDAARQAVLEACRSTAPIRLDETDEYLRQIAVVAKWQRQVQAASQQQTNPQQLTMLQDLAQEAACTHGFLCSQLVQLQGKLQKVAQLQERIRDWLQSSNNDKSPRTETPKWIASLVREVQRLQICFAERIQLERIHDQTCHWVDRATSAIRSRLSLEELQQLVSTQHLLTYTNVDEWTDKLQTRVAAANEWLDQVAAVVVQVPPPGSSTSRNSSDSSSSSSDAMDCTSTISSTSTAEWMQAVRNALEEGHGAELHDLACHGGRLPVQVPAVQLLQAELEARTWKQKAAKWIQITETASAATSTEPQQQPMTNTSNRGRVAKLVDLKEHVEKARVLRDRLVLAAEDRDAWVLPGEAELKQLVQAAEEWLKTFHAIGNKSLAMSTLRQIAEQARVIPVNLSPHTTKVNKALQQAEEWYQQHGELLRRARGGGSGQTVVVQVSELQAAVDAAEADLPIDLDEMLELQQVLDKIKTWQNMVALATGTKPRRGKKVVLTVQDLERLVAEASALPVDTQHEAASVQQLLQSIQNWQTVATGRLQDIQTGLVELRRVTDETYGAPAYYERSSNKRSEETSSTGNDEDKMEVEVAEETKADAESTAVAASGNCKAPPTSLQHLSKRDFSVQALIDTYCREAAAMTVVTPESEIAEILVAVARWCSRSLKYLENQRDIFDKRFFGAFDRFLCEGKALGSGGKRSQSGATTENLRRLRATWISIVDDQLQRMQIILSDRAEYIRFCKMTEAIITSEDKKPTLEKLKDLASKSHAFPGSSDLVQKIRKQAKNSVCWAARAAEAMSMAAKKMTMSEAKALYDEGDKLGFQCSELRQLRSGLKTARGWANRVKKIKIEQGSTHVHDVTALMDEHDSLMVEMPEEIAKLSKATKNYCLCRRPYEGFMVGCDECGEWYHGPCIGVSESKADKFDKYVCVRCCIAKTFKSSATIVVGVIRKWTGEKDLKKARQVSSQKHQRRVRKETKSIEKLQKEELDLKHKLIRRKQSNSGGEAHGAAGPPGPNALVAPVSYTMAVGPVAPLPPPPATIPSAAQVTKPSAPPASGGPAELHPPAGQGDSASMEVDETAKVAAQTEDDGKLSTEEIVSRLSKIHAEVKACESRLAELSEKLFVQKNAQLLEDTCGPLLRKWCIRVRSMVLVPLSRERAKVSRPNADGSFSSAMLRAIDEAERFGLKRFEDVSIVINAFSCMGWTLRATSILARQPSLSDFESLVKQASKLDLPDEKGLRMMKTTLSRAGAWRNKVAKILTPVPDKGMRHCLCGGPSDGRFMLCCDKCEKWFHGHCVGVSSKDSTEELEDWKCPCCRGCAKIPEKRDLVDFHDKFDAEHAGDDEYDVSSNAPKPDEMWPPFGLFNSPKATEVLGLVCCAIPDSTDEWKPEDPSLGSRPKLNHQGVNSAVVSAAKFGAIPSQVQNLSSKSGATRASVPAEATAASCPRSSSGVIPSAVSVTSALNLPIRDSRSDSIPCTPGRPSAIQMVARAAEGTSLTNLISKTSNSVAPKEPSHQGCTSLVSSSGVMQLVASVKPAYSGLIPVAVQNTVNAANITSGGLPSVNPGLLAVNVAAETPRNTLDLTSSVQVPREVLVASIQDTHRD